MGNSVANDIATIGRIHAVPAILQVICETTGMRFAAVARVTENSWTTCAVLDTLGFGLSVGGELDVTTTLCHEIRSSHQTVVIDKASEDDQYCNHHTPRIYSFESYISVPVFRADGSFFGTICALDPRPANLKGSAIQPMMESFARVLSIQMESEESHQRTEVALAKEREKADLRDQFIAVLGHDLRNPLFAITAGAELLQRRLLDAKSQTIAQHILTSGLRATRLVEDVLDFARGRLGEGITLNRAPCEDLSAAMIHVVSEIQRVHPDRLIRLRIGDLQAIDCDRERVTQLLSNLVSNAIHHGAPNGPVDVSADLLEDTFVLGVHNLGKPIEAAVHAKLFQPFTRLSNDAPQSGLGLGLYIASQIAVAHGGRMEVLSTAEAGTLFTFRMPLA
ncbi:GAF domain-containing sensor histidine kinase [Pseudomonas abieticivorans]|uniref:GAF domain-containing sensor histidine kinase n=1 Tax=Pseudomonas abieticivorans TaxID=2931382 RepID=UPI0020BF23F6|nr:GAF domain-containing sensor histidine kinase [Pseudomonas sp. PIA16]